MPVTSYVRGAEGWTAIDHGSTTPHRYVPVGDIHAVEPTAGTAVCSGEPKEADPAGRSFTAWDPGTCAACSAVIEPRAAETPPI